LIFIEVFKAARYVDFSATQWSVFLVYLGRFFLTKDACRLALTPSQTVADLLKISVEKANALVDIKQRLIA
jgi:hypothetical protein